MVLMAGSTKAMALPTNALPLRSYATVKATEKCTIANVNVLAQTRFSVIRLTPVT
jgi:hypothetical protein